MEAIYELVNLNAVGVAALLLGAVMRAMKAGPLRDKVPGRYRPLVLCALGVALMFVEALGLGYGWKQAAIQSLLSASLAALGHGVGIEALRGGRELWTPTVGGKP